MDASNGAHGWRFVDYALSAVVALLTALVTLVGAITRVMWHKIEKLEAERTAAAVTAERLGALAGSVERLVNEQAAHHAENTLFAREEANKTIKWRDEVMTPIIRKLADDNIRHELRLDQLEKSIRNRREGDV